MNRRRRRAEGRLLRSALVKLLADGDAYLKIDPFVHDKANSLVALESTWVTLTREEAAALQAVWDEARGEAG